MRIIAGIRRGLKLFGPREPGVGERRSDEAGSAGVSRPITDRVKESLFSVLYKYDVIEGKIVADVFCGVGSLGLEAISRGAAKVHFVERDRKTAAVLKKNIERAEFGDQAKIVIGDAFSMGAAVGANEEKAALVFVDPPYFNTRDVGAASAVGKLLGVICEQVAEGGIVTVRTHKSITLEEEYGRLKVIDRREWGSMAVTLLKIKD